MASKQDKHSPDHQSPETVSGSSASASHGKSGKKGRGSRQGAATPNMESTRPVKLLGAPHIMLHLHNEHKYMTKLMNVLVEQVGVIDEGGTPDLNIMYDVARYMVEFSDASHHPREDIIYRKLAERDTSNKAEVVNLLIEHESTTKKTDSLLRSIRDALDNPTAEAIQNVRHRCDDYVSSLNTHMDLEESQVFPRILEILTETDWTDIINDIQPASDPLFGKTVEKHYEDLFDVVSREVGKAAEDFTMAELVGLGAVMENIGVIATYGNSIGSIFSRRFKQAYRGNATAYRKLIKARSRSPKDYISVTVDCALNNFDTYTETLRDVGRVLRKARSQIVEPYTSRLRIYHDMARTGSDARETGADGNQATGQA
ncbi:MAG TPA: hemerythrin domain-containing protein [Pseudomonadales bacterium]|nr:hemerythrin domain-containing protein [Pseudomonadales bacterium]